MTDPKPIIIVRDGFVESVLNASDYDVIDMDGEPKTYRIRYTDGTEFVRCQDHLPIEDGWEIESCWDDSDGGDICDTCWEGNEDGN